MKYFIDPTIDCVFKKILAAIGHEKLLLDFLNSILKPIAKIMRIVVQNPYNEKDYLKDKLSIVDIKAQDEKGNTYQIEVQVATPEFLAYRMMTMDGRMSQVHGWTGATLANWGDIYQGQLTEGVGFSDLKPVISIWLLTSNLIKHSDSCHHHFECYDRYHDVLLSNHMAIHVLELAKWSKPDRLQPEDNLYTQVTSKGEIQSFWAISFLGALMQKWPYPFKSTQQRNGITQQLPPGGFKITLCRVK